MRTRNTVGMLLIMAGGLLTTQVHAADFARWRGANSDGSVGDPGMRLADDWQDVALHWMSEQKAPYPWNISVVRGRTHWPRVVLGNGGYGMPAIWDGKIYLHYYEPAGDEHCKRSRRKLSRIGLERGIDAYTLISADGVFLCIDAATGKTVWKTRFEGEELNRVEAYGGHDNVCIHDCKVYGFGNSGRVYCVDARTGEKVWMQRLPTADYWDKFRQFCIDKGELYKGPPAEFERKVGMRKDPHQLALLARLGKHPEGGSLDATTYNVCPLVADGVLITGDWSRSRNIIGLDPDTGRRLWTARGYGGISQLQVWKHRGREYVIHASKTITCLDPRTGKKVWSGGVVSNNGYDRASTAISGDRVIAHGSFDADKDNGVPPEKREGWACYEMSLQGPKKVWSLGGAYIGKSYVAPTIHQGNAWLPFRRPDGVESGGDGCDVEGDDYGLVCVDMKTGKVRGVVGGVPFRSTCPGPVAMGDKMYYQGDSHLAIIDLNPENPRIIGKKLMPVNFCSSLTAADGFIYFRSGERLVVCYDVRHPDARGDAARASSDPTNARFDLAVDEGRADNKDIRVTLCTRDGQFTQSWAQTVGLAHPEVFEADGLQIQGDRISGRTSAYIEAMKYEFDVNGRITRDGRVSGTMENCYRGQPVEGEVTAEIRALPTRNGQFKITWDRGWCGGGNVNHNFQCYIDFEDGKWKGVTFKPRNRSTYDVTIDDMGMKFDGEKLTGTLELTQKKLRAGKYTITFDVDVNNNMLAGRVRTQREGDAPKNLRSWGEIFVPEDVAFDPEEAVYKLWMTGCVPGMRGMYVWLTTKDGRVVGKSTGYVSGCGGLQPVDASGLRYRNGRLQGVLRSTIDGDGYGLKEKNAVCEIEIDMAVNGTEGKGTLKGMYDKREPKISRFEGVWYDYR